jgi:hypothetical protein
MSIGDRRGDDRLDAPPRSRSTNNLGRVVPAAQQLGDVPQRAQAQRPVAERRVVAGVQEAVGP